MQRSASAPLFFVRARGRRGCSRFAVRPRALCDHGFAPRRHADGAQRRAGQPRIGGGRDPCPHWRKGARLCDRGISGDANPLGAARGSAPKEPCNQRNYRAGAGRRRAGQPRIGGGRAPTPHWRKGARLCDHGISRGATPWAQPGAAPPKNNVIKEPTGRGKCAGAQGSPALTGEEPPPHTGAKAQAFGIMGFPGMQAPGRSPG